MRVLITEPDNFSERAIEQLREAGFEVMARQCDYATLKEIIGGYEGIIIRLGINIDQKILAKAVRLKFIASPTTGLDHIDLSEAKKRNIEVISLRGETEFLNEITPTAELAVMLMLMVNRRAIAATEAAKQGEWDRNEFVGHEMKGKVVGIVGMGRLGSMVARFSTALGAKVVYFDPYVTNKAYEEISTLIELAERADILSVHVPLNKETTGLISKEIIDKCGPGTVIINTSRGAVIDEKALLAALQEKRIAGVGLDVLQGELDGKIGDSELLNYAKQNKDVIITPHVGGATEGSMRRTEEFVVGKIIQYLAERERKEKNMEISVQS